MCNDFICHICDIHMTQHKKSISNVTGQFFVAEKRNLSRNFFTVAILIWVRKLVEEI